MSPHPTQPAPRKKAFKRAFLERLFTLYASLMARTYLFKLNRLLFDLSLRGLGVLNSQNARLSGERALLKGLAAFFEAPVIVDVGANTGGYASSARALMPGAAIYALEPHPRTFSRLSRQAAAGGYQAFQVACGEGDGVGLLYDYEGEADGSEHASLYQGVLEGIHQRPAASVEVPVSTLDSFARAHGIARINLLKIDTEGAEYRVLQGAAGLLEAGSIDLIHFEFNEMNVYSRTFLHDIMQLLASYQVFRMLPDGLVALHPYAAPHHELFAYQNQVAIRRDLVPALRTVFRIA